MCCPVCLEAPPPPSLPGELLCSLRARSGALSEGSQQLRPGHVSPLGSRNAPRAALTLTRRACFLSVTSQPGNPRGWGTSACPVCLHRSLGLKMNAHISIP